MSEPIPWHRLFGLTLVDFFRDTGVDVELEKDLSWKQQFLDIVVIRREASVLERPLPDGFESLAPHSLITFKSFQQALDQWALEELVGHYVNYRKEVSQTLAGLLPETDFRLYAVCVRSPQFLSTNPAVIRVQDGAYDVPGFGQSVRVIVAHELPRRENNALLHLFSANPDLLRYGTTHYRQHSRETSTLLRQLFERYKQEGSLMPTGLEQLEQFVREKMDEWLRELPAEERVKGLPAEELMKGFPPEDRLKGLSPEDVLAGLSPEVRSALIAKLKNEGGSDQP
jgi:hypothetical protein